MKKNTRSGAEIVDSFKKKCTPYHSDDFKYENDVFDFGFNYNDNVIVCERYCLIYKKR